MNLDNITSDETFDQAKNSTSSTATDANGCRRSRKVNWTPSSEPETYRTVVINYSYGKLDQNQNLNQSQNQEQSVNGNGIRNRRTRDMWKKSYVDMQDELPRQDVLESITKSDSDLNLRRLYGSMQELKYEEKPLHKAEVIVEPLKVLRKEDAVPMVKSELKTICEDCEVIVISDDEDEDHQLKTVLNNSKTTSTTSHHLTISESTSTDMPEKLLSLDSMDDLEEKIQIKVRLPDNLQSNTNSNNNNSNSNNNNSNNHNNNGASQKLKVKVQPTNTFKQRQLELHRARIAVEQKRLELLEVKLARERDEMIREQVLFEKELELKASQLRQINEDRI